MSDALTPQQAKRRLFGVARLQAHATISTCVEIVAKHFKLVAACDELTRRLCDALDVASIQRRLPSGLHATPLVALRHNITAPVWSFRE